MTDSQTSVCETTTPLHLSDYSALRDLFASKVCSKRQSFMNESFLFFFHLVTFLVSVVGIHLSLFLCLWTLCFLPLPLTFSLSLSEWQEIALFIWEENKLAFMLFCISSVTLSETPGRWYVCDISHMKWTWFRGLWSPNTSKPNVSKLILSTWKHTALYSDFMSTIVFLFLWWLLEVTSETSWVETQIKDDWELHYLSGALKARPPSNKITAQIVYMEKRTCRL